MIQTQHVWNMPSVRAHKGQKPQILQGKPSCLLHPKEFIRHLYQEVGQLVFDI